MVFLHFFVHLLIWTVHGDGDEGEGVYGMVLKSLNQCPSPSLNLLDSSPSPSRRLRWKPSQSRLP